MTYDLRRVETGPEHLRGLAAFLARVFRREDLYVPAYLHWLYVENPAGSVIGVNAWDGDRLAGHYAVLPFEAVSADGRHRAALSLNTATDPADQGRGLFTRLAEQTYALASDEGVREVVGIANANSTPGFVRKLGFRDCGRLAARIAWRRPGLRELPAEASWRRIWDAESLRWRARHPQTRYAIELRAGLRSLLAPTGWPGIRAVLRLEPAAAAAPLELPTTGRPPLWLWLGRSAELSWPPAGSTAIPLRLRPSPLQVIYRSLADGATAPEAERIHFEGLDFDAY
jgi:GNAT superfamily N-acetyltransferase